MTNTQPTCPDSGTLARVTGPRPEKVYCGECGKLVSLTAWGYIRKHRDALA